jgi:phosphatidylserine decarboxylase
VSSPRASLPFDPAGLPFVIGAAALALVAGVVFSWAVAAVVFLVAGGFFAFFFRDPNRHVPSVPDGVLSPADGRVLIAGDAQPEAAPPGTWQQVSIFLSPLDVHVNRVPIDGEVTAVRYKPGRYLPAYRVEAAADNERCEIWIDHRGQTIVVRQVVGILARRVVCRARVGQIVQSGDRYGIMKFGSRMDVFLPVSARIRVAVGDRVRAGETVIAVLH